jgi:DNA-binding transcriptional LysR family regulator
MQGELGEYSKGLEAHIRLWANTAAMTEFLPKALAPFLACRSNVLVNLKERRSAEIVKAVSGGVAEIGIISEAVDHGTLQIFRFATDRLVLIVPRGNALAEHRRIALREVVGHAFVGLSAGNPLQEHLCEQAVLAARPFSFRARMRTFEDVCRMVEHGVGFGIVPQTAAKKYRGPAGIRSIRLTDGWASLALSTRISSASVPRTVIVSSMNASSGIACSASRLFMRSVRTQGGAISSTRTVVSRSMTRCERMYERSAALVDEYTAVIANGTKASTELI